jgi:prepilin-type processing-associated H-X9-DG protein
VMPGKEFPKDFRKKFGGQFPGGFNALMWDGSVRFIPDSVSDRTLAAALSFNGGEILGPDWNGGPQGKK